MGDFIFKTPYNGGGLENFTFQGRATLNGQLRGRVRNSIGNIVPNGLNFFLSFFISSLKWSATLIVSLRNCFHLIEF